MTNRKRTIKILAACAALSITAAACGSDDNGSSSSEAPAATEAMQEAPADTEAMDDGAMTDDTEAMDDGAMTDDTEAMDDGAMTDDTEAMDDGAMTDDTEAMDDGAMEDGAMDESALEPSGPLCSAVPADGAGSFAGMTEDPAATAASNNPALSTLVAAVTEAGLVDTLNSDGPFTIFAPANPAFDALGEDAVAAVLADQELLTSILTLHVVAGEQLSSEDLAELDSVPTVNGEEITIETADDGTITVNGQATVGCADVQTANATVHIIDGVLMPA
jgi:uncharacterized surface protein with fasciclin (FAS1) repeats